MARELPEQSRGRAADERMPHREPPHRHHQVDRGHDQDLARHSQEVEQERRQAAERPVQAEEVDALAPDRLQAARDQRDHQQADTQEQDVQVRKQRGDEEMAPAHRHAVKEDDRHRVLEHGEGERAEKEQRAEEHPADEAAVLEEPGQLRYDRLRLAGNQPAEVALERLEQLGLLHDVRSRDDDENEQRHDREQRVVRHRAGEQQPLVLAECLQHPQREGAGVLQDLNPCCGGCCARAQLLPRIASRRSRLLITRHSRAPAPSTRFCQASRRPTYFLGSTLSVLSFTTLTAITRIPLRLIGKSRWVTRSSSSCMSEKTMMVLWPAPASFRNSAPWMRPPVMSVWRLPDTARKELSIFSRKARFCAFSCEGRESKVALAMMSFSLKLRLCTRATASESPGCSDPRR